MVITGGSNFDRARLVLSAAVLFSPFVSPCRARAPNLTLLPNSTCTSIGFLYPARNECRARDAIESRRSCDTPHLYHVSLFVFTGPSPSSLRPYGKQRDAGLETSVEACRVYTQWLNEEDLRTYDSHAMVTAKFGFHPEVEAAREQEAGARGSGPPSSRALQPAAVQQAHASSSTHQLCCAALSQCTSRQVCISESFGLEDRS